MTTTSPTPMHERNHPVKTDDLQTKVDRAERALRLVWVIAFGAIVFSMLTVTPLVQRVTPDGWDKTAPLLPLVVDAAVIIVVRMDATISGFNVKAGAWPTILRWMTGLFTLGLNIGDSALKGSLVGVCVHAVCPMLLIATSEAIPRYRRTIATAVADIRREQAAEQERREHQQRVREQQDRDRHEQDQARDEQREREQREQAERSVREQRDYEARMIREQRDHEARLEQQRLAQESNDRQAEQERQTKLELARIASEERREQSLRDEQRRREQKDREDKARRERAVEPRREQDRTVREQSPRPVREHPEPQPAAAREHRPLHAVNNQRQAPVNTPKEPAANNDKVSENEALEMIRAAVNTGEAGVRALARKTGWSPAWVSGQISTLRGDTESEDATVHADTTEDEQVSA